MRKGKLNRASYLIAASLGAIGLFPLHAQSATIYVSQALSVLDASNNQVTQLFGSNGNPSAGPVSVSQSLILGPPNADNWVSFTQGEQALFGLGSTVTPVSVFVDVLANGADETGMLYGRAGTSGAFTLIGSLTEPDIGVVGDPPNVETFNLAGTGLSQIAQLEIVSTSSGGGFPGIDIQGLGVNTAVASAPEPEGWTLLTAGVPFIVWVVRRRSLNAKA